MDLSMICILYLVACSFLHYPRLVAFSLSSKSEPAGALKNLDFLAVSQTNHIGIFRNVILESVLFKALSMTPICSKG